MASIKDELTIAAGKVTPGVDETPYIQYALEALTRDWSGDLQRGFPHFDNRPKKSASQPVKYPTTTMPAPAHLEASVQYPSEDELPPFEERLGLLGEEEMRDVEPLPRDQPYHNSEHHETHHIHDRPDTKQPSSRIVPVTQQMRDSIDPHQRSHAPLTYKPRILRPFSLMILMTLCVLMIIALIFTAVYSKRNDGLVGYVGSINSGQYFLFRILPQLLAAVIVLYTQSVVTASRRILPFAALAEEDSRGRYLALFDDLCLTSHLVPRLQGPWQFVLFNVTSSIACLTIPLQSAAFTCIFDSDEWTWAPVQGVVWTLVVINILLLLSTTILMIFWFGHWTGLLWDMRCIADIIPMLNRGNVLSSFERLDIHTDGNLKSLLHDRWFDRLGYWRTDDMLTGGVWWALGSAETDAKFKHTTLQPKRASMADSLDSAELAIPMNLVHSRFRYLPWCLRTIPLFGMVLFIGSALLALLVVAFHPETRLEDGFDPLLTARPLSSAFSAANFLYSFIPSLLGTGLWLLFQSLDQTLRILQPWGELRHPGGSVASKSLLADYAACLPLQATSRALQNGHWRVAVTSLMATLFVLLPVLSGGLFMALTTGGDNVLMFPSIPIFGVLLALLFLYLGCLTLLLPHRGSLALPRAVTSLAGIISLCASSDLVQDPAFRAPRSKADLKGRLGVGGSDEFVDSRDESVWFFGPAPGRDEQRVTVRRMNRFTEKKMRSPRSSRSMA